MTSTRAGRIWEAWPVARRVERMVWHEPFLWDHRDPDLFVLAGVHAQMYVERKANGLAVRPETAHRGEVETAAPRMVCKDAWKDWAEAMMIADIEDMVEETGTNGRDDVLPGGVDDEMIVYLGAMGSGEEGEWAIDVVSLEETGEGGEGEGIDGSVVEKGDVVVPVKVYVIVHGGLDVMLSGSVGGGQA